jgi:hypothetical protein
MALVRSVADNPVASANTKAAALAFIEFYAGG